jgi:hypothetical protein
MFAAQNADRIPGSGEEIVARIRVLCKVRRLPSCKTGFLKTLRMTGKQQSFGDFRNADSVPGGKSRQRIPSAFFLSPNRRVG